MLKPLKKRIIIRPVFQFTLSETDTTPSPRWCNFSSHRSSVFFFCRRYIETAKISALFRRSSYNERAPLAHVNNLNLARLFLPSLSFSLFHRSLFHPLRKCPSTSLSPSFAPSYYTARLFVVPRFQHIDYDYRHARMACAHKNRPCIKPSCSRVLDKRTFSSGPFLHLAVVLFLRGPSVSPVNAARRKARRTRNIKNDGLALTYVSGAGHNFYTRISS